MTSACLFKTIKPYPRRHTKTHEVLESFSFLVKQVSVTGQPESDSVEHAVARDWLTHLTKALFRVPSCVFVDHLKFANIKGELYV